MPRYNIMTTRGMEVHVTLNGQEVKEVAEVDTDLGYVLVAKKDSQGKLMIKDDSIVYEKLTGEIVVTTISRYVPRRPAANLAPVDTVDL